jgi:type II secretory pathway predicted ATPase ExeA/septal ring-binding cell division protein DamX
MPTLQNPSESIHALSSDHAVYWHHYGLTHDPFSENSNDDYYISSQWEHHFDLLHYLCHSSNVLLTVTGAKKIGKTVFLRQFLQYFSKETVQICSLEGCEALSPQNFIAILEEEFQLPHSSGENIEEQLDEYLILLQQGQEICLLVIDDAHFLPNSTLQLLLNLIRHQSQDQMRLHILLVGEPVLAESLNSLFHDDTEKNIIHSIFLEPFDFQETQKYVEDRLSLAGLPAALPFPPSSITQIFQASKGLPNKINQASRQIMIANMRQSRLSSIFNFDFIRLRASRIVGACILFFTFVLLAAFILQTTQVSSQEKKPIPSTTYQHVKKPVSSAPVAVASKDSPQTKAQENKKKPPLALSEEKITAPLIYRQTAQNITDQEKSASTQPSVQTKKAENKANTTPQPVMAQKPQTTTALSIPEMLSQPAKTLPLSQGELTHTNNQKNVKPLAAEIPTHHHAIKITDSEDLASHKTNQIYFVLQLIGLSHQTEVTQFLNEKNLNGKVTVLHHQPHGRDWYTILYGHYKTEAQASEALANLPPAIKNLKPWIRKM